MAVHAGAKLTLVLVTQYTRWGDWSDMSERVMIAPSSYQFPNTMHVYYHVAKYHVALPAVVSRTVVHQIWVLGSRYIDNVTRELSDSVDVREE